MKKITSPQSGRKSKRLFPWCFGLLVVILSTSLCHLRAQPGLVAHYAFNGTYQDQTPNANHATAHGTPAFTTDRFGSSNAAIRLGGCQNPQFLQVPHSASLAFSGAMSIAFWARIDLNLGMDPGTGACNTNGRQVFFAKGGDGYGGSPSGIQGLTYTQEGQQRIFFESSTGSGQVATGASVTRPGPAWHHYTYVITTAEIRLYLDGQLIHSIPVALNFTEANTQDLFLGTMGPKSSPVLGITHWYPLNGSLDDVRIFNRALTPSEVATVYVSDDTGNCSPTQVSIVPSDHQIACSVQQLTLRAEPAPGDVQLQWLKNTQPIALAHGDSLVVTEAGSYQVQATKRADAWKHSMQGPDNALNDIQFVTANRGWIVGNWGTLLKTTNGTTWDTIPLYRNEHLNSVHFVSTEIGWIGGGGGLLLKSTDGGISWNPQAAPTGNIIKIQFLNANTGYLMGNGLLFRTDNGGDNWTSVALPNTTDFIDFSFVDATTGWLAMKTQIFKTNNGGSTWTLQYTISPYGTSGFQRIKALDISTCWAVSFTSTFTTAVARTSNGGTTWTEHDILIPANFPTLSYIFVTDLHFTDSQIGYVTGRMYKRQTSMAGIGSGAIFKTTNGGQNWSLFYDNPFFAQPSALAFATSSQGLLVGNGGLWGEITDPGGVTIPFPERTLLPLTSVGGTPDSVFAVGGQVRQTNFGAHPDSKAVTLSSVNGQNWTKTETGSGYGVGYTLRQVKFKNALFGWQVGFGQLNTTQDGGATWQSLLSTNQPPPNLIIEKAYFLTLTSGWLLANDYIGAGAKLYSFSDSSRTFIDVLYKDSGDPSNTGMLDLQFINNNVGFITTSNGKLIKTTNGGNSWSVHLVQAGATLNRCFFVSELVGWVAGENGVILKTTDGGLNWTSQGLHHTSGWKGLNFQSALDGYVVGTDGMMLKTSDGGTTWVRIITNTHNTLNDIHFLTRDKGFAVGDYGTILAFNPRLLPECTFTSLAVDISAGGSCQSVESGLWNNATTWSCGRVPGACDQVIIAPGHVVSLGESVQIRSLEVRQNAELALLGGIVQINGQ